MMKYYDKVVRAAYDTHKNTNFHQDAKILALVKRVLPPKTGKMK